MKRRRFMLLSAIGAVAVSAPSLRCTGTNTDLDKTLSVPDMLSHLADASTITATGKAYGAKAPGEYSVHTLEQLLADDALNKETNASAAAIRARLANDIKNEFANAKTFIINGWVLSVTEARQCALFSLVGPSK